MAAKRRRRVVALRVEAEVWAPIEAHLVRMGLDARVTYDVDEAERLLTAWSPDVLIAEAAASDPDGVGLLAWAQRLSAKTPVILVLDPERALHAPDDVRAGTFDIVERPLAPEQAIDRVERALREQALVAENERLRQQLEDRYSLDNIVGRSQKMQELFDLVDVVAGSDANILILGENGTGKELIANAIHLQSKRAKGPFIKINCGAIPRDLIESELFGYKKGAFTGAATDKQGLLELAEGGSLLLDEIGDMPPYLQTKLLRVLQEREYRPVGGDHVIRVDFRLICATNTDLDEARREGRLREDLFFRINTITLRVPPLRERTEDIPLICDHFLEQFRHRYQKNVRTLAPAVYHVLIRNRWPGNVRELENTIERAVLVAKGTEITVADLPDSVRNEPATSGDFVIPPHRTLAEIEKMAIVQTLQRTNWNKQEAAQMLGLYRPTLYSKMRKHHIRDLGRGGRSTGATAARPADAKA